MLLRFVTVAMVVTINQQRKKKDLNACWRPDDTFISNIQILSLPIVIDKTVFNHISAAAEMYR